MSIRSKKYALESKAESERLQKQATMKAFDYKSELAFLKVSDGQRILDAGCGSGIVTEYLSKQAKNISVVGWDFSKDRVADAQANYGEVKNIGFEQKNLLELEGTADRFDAIVCRYVLRHFSKTDVKKVIQNLSGVLKPGGTLYCIDVEGLLADSPCASAFLRSALKNIRENDFFDFQVGRRMPSLLLEHGFENVEWHVNTVEFKDEELFLEIENLKQTVTNAEAFVKSRIGAEENGEENFARFQDEYFKMLNDPGNVHFYNKLIATGTKPIAKLSLVKKSK